MRRGPQEASKLSSFGVLLRIRLELFFTFFGAEVKSFATMCGLRCGTLFINFHTTNWINRHTILRPDLQD